MRAWLIGLALAGLSACGQPPGYNPLPPGGPTPAQPDPAYLGVIDDRMVDFAFDGGQLEFEIYRSGSRLTQIARNRYAVPVVIRWSLSELDNLDPLSAVEGVAFLPAAQVPFGAGAHVVLARLDQVDTGRHYHKRLFFRARFGDPRAQAAPYAYGLPYPLGLTFSVLQGFHGAFSHRGSNEFAIDFDCPVATPVLATRPGMVVAANAAAQGAGTTPEFLDYKRTNFVLVAHDDGTLGEYMHLAPSGIEVTPGQRVERGNQLALSGNTGFSSTPHLHFQVMTSSEDGLAARSFPFQLATAPGRVEEPLQGRRYSAWETR